MGSGFVVFVSLELHVRVTDSKWGASPALSGDRGGEGAAASSERNTEGP